MTQQKRKSVYEMVTARVVSNLEKGLVPWRKTWNGQDQMPQNLFSKKHYRGTNILLLAYSEFKSPYWATFNQISDHGGKVLKGSKSEIVVFWKVGTKKVEDTETGKVENKKTFLLRYYNVFNIEQTEGLEKYIPVIEESTKEFNPVEKAEEIIRGYKNSPAIYDDGRDRAYYSPVTDEIHLPLREVFESESDYYTTLFHEATHSTGNKKRLNRFTPGDYKGSDAYSKEELVAEMGATFLSSMAGMENKVIENNSAYINGWLSKLNNDKTLVVFASSQAQKATNLILGEVEKEKETVNA